MEKTVKKLLIAAPPKKTSYLQGEMFNPQGIIVNAEHDDGTVAENVGFTVITNSPLHPNDAAAVIEYGGAKAEIKIKVRWLGNVKKYCVSAAGCDKKSPLKDKTYLFLGSSVTVGSGPTHDSMADYIAKRNGCNIIKVAVSGTTLADTNYRSYVRRLDKYIKSKDRAPRLDAFICQLSTNDSNIPELFGSITSREQKDKTAFDKSTTLGAIEYIVATVKETWDCDILFYTNSYFDKPQYAKMVDALTVLSEKWGFTIIDLYNDREFNDISNKQRELYMHDDIHPTRAGYRDWWTPKFEEALKKLL
ncbi:MAG: SGNH/GDSL hydrolase family protein [Clostridiales bacterium]|nr:SGNH/GDSL hydrolase family protein [Clostridiales bacterium]